MKILLIALCILFLLAVCKKVKTTSARSKKKDALSENYKTIMTVI